MELTRGEDGASHTAEKLVEMMVRGRTNRSAGACVAIGWLVGQRFLFWDAKTCMVWDPWDTLMFFDHCQWNANTNHQASSKTAMLT